MAYFEGKIALTVLQGRLAVCFLCGAAAYAAIEIWERIARRRKVYGEAKVAKDRFESGKGPDPDYLYQVTLGPPGFSCRMPDGDFERPWSAISRVLWDRGGIIICHAGTAVQRDALAVYIPAVAFDDPSRARDALNESPSGTRPPRTSRRLCDVSASSSVTRNRTCDYNVCSSA